MPDTETSEGSSIMTLDLGDSVDISTFSQILEMDEDEGEREFSKPLVVDFFEQAKTTFAKMDTLLEENNLAELSKLGHFLKGSSATLGFNKIRDSCQVIQQYGNRLKLDNSPEPEDDVCVARITEALTAVKIDFVDLEKTMNKFFNITPTKTT